MQASNRLPFLGIHLKQAVEMRAVGIDKRAVELGVTGRRDDTGSCELSKETRGC